MDEKIVRSLLVTLVFQKVIRFGAHLYLDDFVTVHVESPLFLEQAFSMDIPRDDWDDGPTPAFVNTLLAHLKKGDVKPRAYDEQGNESAESGDPPVTAPPMILELNQFANLCGFFFNMEHDEALKNFPCRVNNGYNCRHPKQEEYEEENGVQIGKCLCKSCPLGFPPGYDDLVRYGIVDPAAYKSAEEYEMGHDTDYIWVTDEAALRRLQSFGVKGAAAAASNGGAG